MLYNTHRVLCGEYGVRASFLVVFGPSFDLLEPFPAVLEHRKHVGSCLCCPRTLLKKHIFLIFEVQKSDILVGIGLTASFKVISEHLVCKEGF